MKSRPSGNHARRGMGFEGLIEYSNQIYLQRDIAVINKRPTPVKVINMTGGRITYAVFEKPSTVDFDGIYKGRPIQFEAKSTQELTRFDLKNVEQHQVDHLARCHKHGGICFLLIEFAKHGTVYLIPYETFLHYWYNRKPGVKGTQSISLSDMEVNAYEVREGHVPVDFLEVVDRIWGDSGGLEVSQPHATV